MSASEDFLATPLQFLKGVGPRRAADLAHAGLHTVEDLLYRFPLRYEDRSRLQPIASLKPGQTASIAGRVAQLRSAIDAAAGLQDLRSARQRRQRRDSRDLAEPALPARRVRGGPARRALRCRSRCAGSGGLQLTNPQYEILDDEEGETIHTGRIVPVYEKAGSVTPKIQRRLVHDVLDRMPPDLADPLPEALRLRARLSRRAAAALRAAHFPPADCRVEALNQFDTPAQQRLIFEEAFLFQLGVLARRRFAADEREAGDDPRGRSDPRVGARGAAVQADAGTAAGAQGDRRRPCSGRSR